MLTGIRWATQMDPSLLCSQSSDGPCGDVSPRRPCSTRSSGSARPRWTMVSHPRLVQMQHIVKETEWSGMIESYGIKKRAEAVKNCRKITKKDMKHNDATPKMTGESSPSLPVCTRKG